MQSQDLTEVMRMATVTVIVTTMEHEIHDDDSTLHTTCYETTTYVSRCSSLPQLTNGHDEYEMSCFAMTHENARRNFQSNWFCQSPYRWVWATK
jgi:hypothetical protein